MKIEEIIKQDILNKKDKYKGRKHYFYKPKKKSDDIVDIVDSDGNVKTIKLDNKSKMYTNYFRLLVDQKMDYVLAKEPTFKDKFSQFDEISLHDILDDMSFNASLDGKSWLHLYVENNQLNTMVVEDVEIIPFYDRYNKKIIKIIRYFEIEDKTYKVEIWDLTGVEIVIIKDDKIISSEKMTHYTEFKIYQDQVIDSESKNLPFIPFIPLYNNKPKESDIEPIEELIEFYNQISSGFIDNIYKFQEAIMKLKGFSGNEETLQETWKNLKKYKMAGLPNDGDMEYMAIEIPVQARQVIMDLLKQNIFRIGRGHDSEKIGDGNITNVVIKSRYYDLDQKANRLIKQLYVFYKNFIECINLFYKTSYKNGITFNKTIIFNESETIDNCIKSLNIISLETILENHPWIKDLKTEKERLDEENKVSDNNQDKVI